MTGPARVAYFTNHYPATSHSFIRREILALEALGVTVDRYTVRAATGDLPDAADRAEKARTTAILSQGAPALIGATMSTALRSPGRFVHAAKLALGMARTSGGGLLRHLAYLAEAAWLARRMNRDGIRHLHAHFGTNPAAVARLCRALGGPRYSFTVHGPDEFDAPRPLDLAGKIADSHAVVAISSFGRSQLMRWSAPAEWAKIAIVRCGVDEAFLDHASDLPPPPDAPELVAVARLSAQKGLPLLIEAAACLKSEGRAFHLRIIGEGELRPLVEAMIDRHDLGEYITLAGACDAATVRAHLLAARTFVLPSFAEGLPVVIMEALALERPVIVSAIAGTPELVDATCGWLVPAGAVEELVTAMRAALDATAADLHAMGRVGAARVRSMHDARTNAAALLPLFGKEAS